MQPKSSLPSTRCFRCGQGTPKISRPPWSTSSRRVRQSNRTDPRVAPEDQQRTRSCKRPPDPCQPCCLSRGQCPHPRWSRIPGCRWRIPLRRCHAGWLAADVACDRGRRPGVALPVTTHRQLGCGARPLPSAPMSGVTPSIHADAEITPTSSPKDFCTTSTRPAGIRQASRRFSQLTPPAPPATLSRSPARRGRRCGRAGGCGRR